MSKDNAVEDVAKNDVKYYVFVKGGREGRGSWTLEALAAELPKHNAVPEQIKEITMDMFPAYISGAAAHFPQAGITFDKFHLIQILNNIQDTVRRMEQKTTPQLKYTRYIWLKNPDKLTVLTRKLTLACLCRISNILCVKETCDMFRIALHFFHDLPCVKFQFIN